MFVLLFAECRAGNGIMLVTMKERGLSPFFTVWFGPLEPQSTGAITVGLALL